MKLYQFLQQNLEVIEQKMPRLHQWLMRQEYDTDSLENDLFVNEQGFVDRRLPGGGSLFAKMPPQLFYHRWQAGDKPHTSATFLIGANLGYGINHMLMCTPQSHKLLVLEPRADMLLACLGQSDYRPFFEAGKLHFVLPTDDDLRETIRHLDLQFLFGAINVKQDLASMQLGSEYAHWTEQIKRRMANFSVELTTLRHSQDTMVGNELKNFARAAGEGSLKQLAGAAKGLTGVIIGAGPSLAHTAPCLEQLDGALRITALQTLPALKDRGIKPDMAVVLDYTAAMNVVYDKLDTEWAADIPLIYSSKVNPDVLAAYPGPTIPLWTLGGVSSFVMNKNELVLDAGGNVGVTMFRLLEHFGCERVLLAGQDFASIGGSFYSSGHHAAGKDLAHRAKHTVADIHGNQLATTAQLVTGKNDLEDDIRTCSMAVYNLYGGGAAIAGTTVVQPDTFGQAIAEHGLDAGREPFAAFSGRFSLALSTPRPRPVFDKRAPQWTTSIKNARKRLDKLFKKPERNQQAIWEMMQQLERFVRQDPLYTPYLYNEVMDMAELARGRRRYVRTDLPQVRALLGRVLTKVRHMDDRLDPARAVKQAA